MSVEFIAQSIVFFFVVLQCILNACAEEKTFTFDVKPGGETHTFTEKLGDVSCSFTYSSQGGTNEIWSMALSKQTDYTCEVSRPDKDSYLMFEKFDLKIKGAYLKDAVVFYNKEMKEVPTEEYHKDFSKASVRNTKKFQGHLHRVIALASTNKEDL